MLATSQDATYIGCSEQACVGWPRAWCRTRCIGMAAITVNFASAAFCDVYMLYCYVI